MKAALSAGRPGRGRPGARTPLTGAAANRRVHRRARRSRRHRRRSGTLLATIPLLTARGAYRRRPLTRVVFDRRLRTPPSAAAALDARRRAGHNREHASARCAAARSAPGRSRPPAPARSWTAAGRRYSASRAARAGGDGAVVRAARRRAPRCTGRSGTRGSSTASRCTSPRVALGPGGVPWWPTAGWPGDGVARIAAPCWLGDGRAGRGLVKHVHRAD